LRSSEKSGLLHILPAEGRTPGLREIILETSEATSCGREAKEGRKVPVLRIRFRFRFRFRLRLRLRFRVCESKIGVVTV